MSELSPVTVDMAGYLGVNKYAVDEGNPHIELAAAPDPEEFLKLVRVCPAALYKLDAAGGQTFDFAGCLECGTCRIEASGTVVAEWHFPGPTMGVQYRYG